MAKRLTRASLARLAVGMAVLALPLFAVGTAQAAIAGAPAESTTTQPDLVSASALTSSTVAYCFDKPLNTTNQVFAAGNFSIGGYRAANTQTSSSVVPGPGTNCLTASFSSVGDINSYTVATVAANSISTGTTTPVTNSLADSTPLLTSTSKSGTTGYTVAPDLLLATPNPGPGNTMTFLEDQQVAAAVTPPPTAFSFTSSISAGPPAAPITVVCTSTGVSVSGNTVTVAFNPAPAGFPANACLVSNAVRASQAAGALFASADPAIPSPPETAPVAGVAVPTTAAPNLVATSDPSPVAAAGTSSTITYTFDKPITAITGAAGNFYAVLSTGAVVPATTVAAVTAPATTTVTATFAGMQNYANYVVGVGVVAGSVHSNVTSVNGPDFVKAGDNANGFARGFTTAPDAVLAFPIVAGSFNQIELVVDQPATSYNPASFVALDGTGAPIATAGSPTALLPVTSLGAQTITLTFAPTTATTIKNLALAAGALSGPALPGVAPTGGSQSSISQILSVTSSSTLLHREKLARSQHVSKHALKAHQAKVRKQEKQLLHQLSKKIHHKV